MRRTEPSNVRRVHMYFGNRCLVREYEQGEWRVEMTKQRKSMTSTRRLMTNDPQTETTLSNEKERERERERERESQRDMPRQKRKEGAGSDGTGVTRRVNIRNGLDLQ